MSNEPKEVKEDSLGKTQHCKTAAHRQQMQTIPLSKRLLWLWENLSGIDAIHRMALEAAVGQLDIATGIEVLFRFRRLPEEGNDLQNWKAKKDRQALTEILELEAERRAKNSKACAELQPYIKALRIPPLIVMTGGDPDREGKLEEPKDTAVRVMEALKTDPILQGQAEEITNSLRRLGVDKVCMMVEDESDEVFEHGGYFKRIRRVRALFNTMEKDLNAVGVIMRKITVALIHCTTLRKLLQIALRESQEGQSVRDRQLLEERVDTIRDKFVRCLVEDEKDARFIALSETADSMGECALEIFGKTGAVEMLEDAAERLMLIAEWHKLFMHPTALAALRKRFTDCGLFKPEVDQPRPEIEPASGNNDSGKETTGEPPPTDS